MSDQEMYTPEEDVTEVGPDGLSRLVAPKGVPIPMEEAKRRGLVKAPKQTGPSETKEETAAKVKASTADDAPTKKG